MFTQLSGTGVTSRPLFMRVAESTVILRPMLQLGCFSASATCGRQERGDFTGGEGFCVSNLRRWDPWDLPYSARRRNQ